VGEIKPKHIILIILFTLAVFISTIFALGSILSLPIHTLIGSLPRKLKGTNVSFISKTGNPLAGCLVMGDNKHGGVLLMHGVRSNRREMIERAIFLNQNGYSVLLFDFQAHGESPGKQITFGYLEAQDAEAAFTFLEKQLKIKSIGVIGMSLGGASAILGDVSQRANAMVLEAVYPTLEEAVQNRITMRLGEIGRYLSPLIMWQIEPRLGFDPKRLSPIKQLAHTKAALLIIAGTEDKHTTIAESKRMYDAAPKPKQFWAVQGASHQNLHQYSSVEYQRRVLNFFKQYLLIPELT
jgi:esterase/lipase